jgi:NAD(P)-dependent dehydrogenase (short-subunit alcohol dehydrogenase family)
VTGCSAAFAYYLAEDLLEAGEKVVVTARETEKGDLEQKGDALTLPLDVVDRDQFEKGRRRCRSAFRSDGPLAVHLQLERRPPLRRSILFNVMIWRRKSRFGWAGLPSSTAPSSTSEITPAWAPISTPMPTVT